MTGTRKLIVAICLMLGFTLNVLSIQDKTLTFDEEEHYDYGYQWVQGHPERSKDYMDSKMPFSAFNLLPRITAEKLFELKVISQDAAENFKSIEAGRIMTILFASLLGYYVFLWSARLYGFAAGIFSLLLCVFSPTMIAHARLVTTDLYAACTITIAIYYFWQFMNTRSLFNAFKSALTLSLCQLAKYTGAYLFIVFAVIYLVRYAPFCFKCFKRADWKRLFRHYTEVFGYVLMVAIVLVVVLNVGFLGHKSFVPLGEYAFRSELFQSLQSTFLAKWPVPVPYPFLDGMDWVKYNEAMGISFSNSYLLGEIIQKGGEYRAFPNYFLLAFLYKVPIITQLLLIATFFLLVFRRNEFKIKKNEAFLIIPFIFFAIYFNYFFKAQMGIRFILIIFPLIFVLCGALVKNYYLWKPVHQIWPPVAIIGLAYCVLSVFPHYISYFNELVQPRHFAYKYLADSNLNWGQNENLVNAYREKNPDVPMNPKQPKTGQFIVDSNYLVGIFGVKRYEWVRENLEPVDHIGYTHLIYNVTQEELFNIAYKYKQKQKNNQ